MMDRTLDILGARILIVDDQEANVQLLEGVLGEAGYTCVTSTMDPQQVCALHRENHYDLILLDLQMPGMDGFAVMAGPRDQRCRHLPAGHRAHGAAGSQVARVAGRREGLHQQAVRPR